MIDRFVSAVWFSYRCWYLIALVGSFQLACLSRTYFSNVFDLILSLCYSKTIFADFEVFCTLLLIT